MGHNPLLPASPSERPYRKTTKHATEDTDLDGPQRVIVDVENRMQRDNGIDEAVTSMGDAAKGLPAGILVTRSSFRTYTVGVSPLVPFGVTAEIDES